MEAERGALSPLHCSTEGCAIARLFPSASLPLTHDDATLAWQACASLSQLCHLQLHYYHSHLPFTPTYHGALHSETRSILPSLAAVTASGLFLPTFSQPAVAADELNQYYVRSGCPQRAAVSGWTSEAGVQRIRAAWQTAWREAEMRHTEVEASDARATGLHICITPPSTHSQHQPSATPYCLHPAHLPCVVPISRAAHSPTRPSVRQRLNLSPLQSAQPTDDSSPATTASVTTSVGGGDTRRGKELEDWRRALSGGGRRSVEAEGWLVWLVDEQWERKEWLWQFLIDALAVPNC